MKRILCLIFTITIMASARGASLTSPGGNITAETDGAGLTVRCKGKDALAITSLGIALDGKACSAAQITAVSEPETVTDSYTMLGGKRLQCSNTANSYTLSCKDADGGAYDVEVRLYDDGIALRYLLKGLAGSRVTDELTTYTIPEGKKRWLMKFNEAYEDFFPMSKTTKGETADWGYPCLFEAVKGTYALVTEAAVERCHSASHLRRGEADGQYRVAFPANEVKNQGDWASPWRVAIIGSLADAVQSTLVTDLSAPSRIADTSWIAPGSVSWVYWAYNHGSKDYAIVKQYIDMAATLGLPYVLIDAEWDEMTGGGTIEDAVAYALSLGVKPMIWYNSSTAWIKEWGAPGPHNRLNDPADREAEFAKIAGWGVAGVKIDFFKGDEQPTMEYCIDLLESAARHKLMVNFHGATVPRGWQRTYPNLVSTEAVYGAEWYNNLPVLTDRAAAHNCTLPFTRNVVGSMDYTPCTFSDSQHPHITTRAHELALPVVFESAMLHWADKPESYLAQPEAVKHLIGTLPTVWDETRLIGGYPGAYVAMARRSGDTWYVSALNGYDEPQVVTLNWQMLDPETEYDVTEYADNEGATDWQIESGRKLHGDLPVSVYLQPRGGYTAVIR